MRLLAPSSRCVLPAANCCTLAEQHLTGLVWTSYPPLLLLLPPPAANWSCRTLCWSAAAGAAARSAGTAVGFRLLLYASSEPSSVAIRVSSVASISSVASSNSWSCQQQQWQDSRCQVTQQLQERAVAEKHYVQLQLATTFSPAWWC